MSIATADIEDAKPAFEPAPKKRGGVDGHTSLPNDFDELGLFALLKTKFGPPNGFLTSLGKPGGDPDGPFKWDYLFCPEGTLHLQIVRGVNGIEALWWNGQATGAEILSYLVTNLDKYSTKIKKAIDELDHYTLILNPFVRHKTVVDVALRDLDKIHPRPPVFPSSQKTTKQELDRFSKQYKTFMANVDTQASLTMLVVLESAFMAEAYLNLMLAFLLRNEIQSSPSILQETLMRKWRSKVERLPVDCNYITSPNMGDIRVRDAKEMFDLRNRIAHSYPDKKEMKVGEMWFEQSFPILRRAEPFHKFAIALHNQLPSKTDAIRCASSSRNFINFLAELIEPKVRKEFEFAAESNPLGFNETKGIQ